MNFGLDPVTLIIPAFVAGLLIFLAPCTLPLLPAYLGFISGVSHQELRGENLSSAIRKKIFLNGLWYVVGFSVVFILLGSVFGIAGAALVKQQIILRKIGGVIVMFFGLFMIAGQTRMFYFLNKERRWHLEKILTPGQPLSSFLLGASFAFGWTPCIGPILASVLLLASSAASVATGAFLLAVFSAGLAFPFLIIALVVGRANSWLSRFKKLFTIINIVGGLFLMILGWLLYSNQFGVWLAYAYKLFDFINYNRLLNYL